MFDTLRPAGVIAAALIAPPSAALLGALAGIEVAALDAGLQVDLMVAWERVMAWAAGCQLPVIAVVGDTAFAAASEAMEGLGYSAEMPYRASHAEIGCALRESELTGERRLAMARMIAVELPAVHRAMLDGDISYRHAVAFGETAEQIDVAADRTWVAAQALPKARRQTVSQLRRVLKRLLLAVNPKTAAERHAKAVADRTLEWFPLPDGMAELRLTASGPDVKAVFNTVDAAARAMPKKTLEGRHIPIAARRADALVAMIAGTCGGATSGAAATAGLADAATGGSAGSGQLARRPAADIQVTIDLPTLLGLADHPAELAGYGPIPASLARSLAADGKWRRLICDPLTGALLDLGTTVYKPNAELTRFIRSRDTRCIFSNCHQPAHRCEIDHTKPYLPGDPATGTDRCNLGSVCEYHHDLKHDAGWQLHRDPEDHTVTWTSNTGHDYHVDHHDYRTIEGVDFPVSYRVIDRAPRRVEISWKDFQHLLPHEDDGQSDWDSFIKSHLDPPDPTASEPAYEPHEDYNFADG